MNYFVSRDNQQYGPYTLAELQRYVAEGNILRTDLVRSEASEEWVTAQQVVGNINVQQATAQPNYGQIPVYPGQGLSALSAAEIQAPPALPPGLHWGLVLLFAVLTCGIFSTIWMFVQSVFIRKIKSESNALILYSVGVGLMFFSGVLGTVEEAKAFAPLINFGGIVVLIVGHFSLKGSIEEAFNLQLSGGMTFFFNVIYFQYHLSQIRNEKLTGIVS